MENKKVARNRRLLVAGGAVALTALIAGCAQTQAPALSGGGAFGHVHGLDVDASRGVAYIATHAGVWKLPPLDSDPVAESDLEGPIGERAMDAMGFTMDGPTMYASGHPDPAEHPDLSPANVGLLTSFDNGGTWQRTSLWGETDFHDLTVFREQNATVRIYGHDAATGIVRFSLDSGRTWNDGQRGDFRDLVAHPLVAGTLYATSADGLMVSTDDAMSFSLVSDAPALYLVDSAESAGRSLLAGLDVDGVVWLKIDDGEWKQAGTLPSPAEAFTVSDGEQPVMIVADAERVSVSNDLGSTWRELVVRSNG